MYLKLSSHITISTGKLQMFLKPSSHITISTGRKEGNVLFNDTLNAFFIYGYIASYIWLRTILIVRKETRYSFRLTARVLLYAPFHRQDSTYHGLCYTSCGPLAGTRNSSMGPAHEGSIRRPIAPWANALTTELHLAPTISTGTLQMFTYFFYNSNNCYIIFNELLYCCWYYYFLKYVFQFRSFPGVWYEQWWYYYYICYNYI